MIFTSAAIHEAIWDQQKYQALSGELKQSFSPAQDDRWQSTQLHHQLESAPRIVIEPFDEQQMNPNSYNLLLHPDLLVYDFWPIVQRFPGSRETTRNWQEAVQVWENERQLQRPGHGWNHNLELAEWKDALDVKQKPQTYSLTVPEEGAVLLPGKLYLARSVEYTESHNCVPGIEGRSSLGRLGISIHTTAGYGDIGFCGTWTLEITVTHPVRVYPRIAICQLQFSLPHGRITQTYRGKYQGQIEATACRLYLELQSQEPQA